MTFKKHIPACIPENEAARLAALRNYDILDTPPEVAFDRLTKMAAHNLGMPITLVSLIDEQRQWFKSHHGLEATETHRDLAFCAHVILKDAVMVVPDATADARFAENPLVTGAPDIRFYAGAPLISGDGQRLGTFCVIDRVPHFEFGAEQQQQLTDYAAIAMDEMELRRMMRQLNDDIVALQNVVPLDLGRLQIVAETQPEKQTILGLFFTLVPASFAQLDEAIARGDEQGWARALHAIKGMAANLGMQPLYKLCEFSRGAAAAAWPAHLAYLHKEHARIRTYVTQQDPRWLGEAR